MYITVQRHTDTPNCIISCHWTFISHETCDAYTEVPASMFKTRRIQHQLRQESSNTDGRVPSKEDWMQACVRPCTAHIQYCAKPVGSKHATTNVPVTCTHVSMGLIHAMSQFPDQALQYQDSPGAAPGMTYCTHPKKQPTTHARHKL